MINLGLYRSSSESLSDLINFAALASEETILCKDGAYLASFFYAGPDANSSTFAELSSISERLNQALIRLGAGWMLHTDAIRLESSLYPMEGSLFPDSISSHIDEERRHYFEAKGSQYETVYVLSLSYLPPRISEMKFYDFLLEDPSPRKSFDHAGKTLEYFERSISDIEAQLSSVLRLQRIGSEGASFSDGTKATFSRLLQYLHFTVTGKNHPIRLPSTPMYIDSILGWEDLEGGLSPKVGKRHLKVINIEGLPGASYPSILHHLDHLPLAYRWSTRFIFMDQSEAISKLKSYRKKWKQKTHDFTDQLLRNERGPINQDALSMVSDIDSALREATGGLVAYGFYTSVVVLMDEDLSKLQENVKLVKGVIQDLGFSAREEDVNSLEAWLGSIPSHGVQNVRRPPLHTKNLSHLMPTSSVWPGHLYNPSPLFPPKSPPLMLAVTEGSTTFRLNLHVSDVGHSLILGPTGAGKSSLLGMLKAQWLRYPNARVFTFDNGYSLLPLTLGVGGVHHDVGGDDDQLQFCPLSDLSSPSDQLWAEEWIEQLMLLQGIKTSPRHRNAISDAMKRHAHSEERSLTDFFANLQDRELREALEYYTVSRATGRLLDGRKDKLQLSNVQTFEMKRLMSLGEKQVLPVLTYLFHRIDKASDGSPTLLIVDEAWTVLGHPAFREKLREWLKTKRRANVAVVLASQSISDAERSGIMDILMESCPTKIFLPNPSAEQDSSRLFYERLSLNPQQIKIIKNAVPKRDYYLTSPEGDRLFQLGMSRFSLSFAAATSEAETLEARKLYQSHQTDWVNHWLRKRGLL